MTTVLVLTVGFFMLLFCILFMAVCISWAMKYAVVTGMKEVLSLYLQKKKEAIEELEKTYGKAGNSRFSDWQA